MSVTIGIATRNRAVLLPKAINSVLAQNYVNKRVVVFDDASDDDTPALQASFPSVEWIRVDRPQGYMAARNQIMREAKTDYYLSLDDDAWFMGNDEIAVAVECMEAKPHVAAAAYDILSPDQPDPRPRSFSLRTHMFIGCGHILRLDAVRKAGFYCQTPGEYGGEEKDLSLRLLDAGYELLYLPGVHVWHDKTPLARDLLAQYRSGVCNDLVLALRRCPTPLIFALLPGKMLSHLRFAHKRGLLRAYFQGIWLFLRSVPLLLPLRKPVSIKTYALFRKLSHRPLP
jgi:GT2 family glycosyltransferase